MWTFQGLMAYLGRDYEANPKRLEQLKQDGIKLDSEIEYNEVVELYSKLNEKYKIILRIMMYSGLNPIDILKLTPKDFIKVNRKILKKLNDKKTNFYYVIKERTKTKRKNVLFLLVFAEGFFNELKNYFERTITVNLKNFNTERIKELESEMYVEKTVKGDIKKDKNKNAIEKNRYRVVYKAKEGESIRYEGKYHWEHDLDVSIFNGINNSTTVSDNFKYFVDKHSLNVSLKPYYIRSLCFTMLKDQFTFKDENLYQLWTQHKVKGVVNRNYITDNLHKLINKYLPKIESTVLIGSLKHTLEKANEYKEKADGVKDNSEEIMDLKLENNKLMTMINDLTTSMDKVKKDLFKAMEFMNSSSKLEEVRKELDEYKV